MRISRPCYDKRRRCPGWAGGGMHRAKVERCDGGYIDWTGAGVFTLRQCPTCGVWVLPAAFAALAPSNIWFSVRYHAGTAWWEIRKGYGFLVYLRYESPLPWRLRRLIRKEWCSTARKEAS